MKTATLALLGAAALLLAAPTVVRAQDVTFTSQMVIPSPSRGEGQGVRTDLED